MKYLPGFCYSYYMSWFQPQQDNTVPAINLLTSFKKICKIVVEQLSFQYISDICTYKNNAMNWKKTHTKHQLNHFYFIQSFLPMTETFIATFRLSNPVFVPFIFLTVFHKFISLNPSTSIHMPAQCWTNLSNIISFKVALF